MGKLYFEGEGIIKHDGKIIQEYEYLENEELILEFLPFINSQSNSIPYAITLTIEDGKITTQSELIKVIDWDANYEIHFFAQIIESYVPPVALAQKTIYQNNYDISVTVYKDNKTRIIVEAPELFYIHTPKWDIENPKIRMSQFKDKVVVAITATNNDKKYLNVILITNNCRILWEDIADKIDYNKNNITFVKTLDDMRGRQITYSVSYNGSSYKEISKIIKYTYEHKYKQELLPYLLIEAIMAKDQDDIKNILDSSLNAESINDFFGEIVNISEPKYSNCSNDNVIAIIVKENNYLKAKLYEFEMKEDKIINIIELD